MNYKWLVALVTLCSAGCANLPTGDRAKRTAPASDGLGVLSERNVHGKRHLTSASLSELPPQLLLMVDESDARLGEPVNFDKVNRVLNICRGC